MLRLMIFSLLGLLGWTAAEHIMLIGGGLRDDNDEIYGKFVEMAGGPGVARIGIVTAASGDPQSSADFYVPHFEALGAVDAYWIEVHEGAIENNMNPVIADRTAQMTGLFFGGGDQARLLTSFFLEDGSPSLVLEAMHYVRDKSFSIIGGTSAGAVGLTSEPMIQGGLSWEALRFGAAVYGEAEHDYQLVYSPSGGLGFFGGYVLDSHFSERGREGRLIRLASDTDTDYVLGIDEDTAFLIHHAGGLLSEAEVIGTNGVFWADLRSAEVGERDGEWMISHVYTAWLTAGDRMHMSTHVNNPHSVTFDETWKTNIIGNEQHEFPFQSVDIFWGNRANPNIYSNYIRTARSVLDSWGTSTSFGHSWDQELPRFRVDFRQSGVSQAYGGTSPYNGLWTISYSELVIDMGAD